MSRDLHKREKPWSVAPKIPPRKLKHCGLAYMYDSIIFFRDFHSTRMQHLEHFSVCCREVPRELWLAVLQRLPLRLMASWK